MPLVIFILFFFTLCNLSISSRMTVLDKDYLGYSPIRILDSSCNYIVCPPTQGYCRSDKCVCLEGFLTILDDANHKFCTYRQKSMMTALLLESFGLIGMGHLYAGRIFMGLLKTVCFYIIICYGSQFVIQFLKESTDSDVAYYVKILISIACIGSPVVWHIIDLYKWANNDYLDGNGQPLLDW